MTTIEDIPPTQARKPMQHIIRPRFAIFAGLLIVAGFGGLFWGRANAATYSGCHVGIERGDTLTRIADDLGLTVEELAFHNDIDNPDVIYAGESMNSCPTIEPVDVEPEFEIGVAASLFTPALEDFLDAIADPCVESRRQEPTSEEYVSNGIVTVHGLTWELVKNTDLCGEDLRVLAAVCAAESMVAGTGIGPRQFAEGDTYLMTNGWGPSFGICQVRSHEDYTGTGMPRDIEALMANVSHQAWAAGQIWHSQGIGAWSCHADCDWEFWLPHVDEAMMSIFP